MTLTEIVNWNDYNDWANNRLCSMLKAAFGEEADLRGHSDSSVRAIQEIAVHSIAAQAIWRGRITGQSSKPPLDAADYPMPLAIRFALGAERARFRAWLSSLANDADLQTEISYTNLQGMSCRQPLADILQHLFFHTMYHRGQMAALLINTGHEAALLPTDWIVYRRDLPQK